ncbi:MAG TPA: hypothetical protein VGX25_08405 [Actinophytocola sp.]|uniref:hypothetical protein n=1 Tax=Actinophytocola sp. TaxID=1872138 RepID=UPI002DDD395F|nr:hypothetical protein [Actinophytocola sp.]HEV2779410.1 hypothetical protein [Actinophytocola sp.]
MSPVQDLIDRWHEIGQSYGSQVAIEQWSWDGFTTSPQIRSDDGWWIDLVCRLQQQDALLQFLREADRAADLQQLAERVVAESSTTEAHGEKRAHTPEQGEDQDVGPSSKRARTEDTTATATASVWVDADTGLAWDTADTAIDHDLYRPVSREERAYYRTLWLAKYDNDDAFFRSTYGEHWDAWRTYLHGHWSASDTEVYIRRRYRRVSGGRPTQTDDARLRMLDRVARLAHVPDDDGSPHLAVAVNPESGTLAFAGNSGRTRVVRSDQQRRGSERLGQAIGSGELGPDFPSDDRLRKDALKVRALLAGDYAAVHGSDWAPLVEALRTPDEAWHNVDDTSKFVEHGEMTLLGSLLLWMQTNPAPPGDKVIPIGGVKLTCGACQWAVEAFNEHIGGPLGYRVATSGDHGGLFAGWAMPDWLVEHPPAYESVAEKATAAGWTFIRQSGRYVLRPVGDDDPRAHSLIQAYESDSDWEPV